MGAPARRSLRRLPGRDLHQRLPHPRPDLRGAAPVFRARPQLTGPALRVRRCRDVADFEARTLAWLVQREAEHNVLLGLLPQLRASDHGYRSPIYLAAIEADGEVAGCAFRTPPFPLGITRLPVESLAALVDQVAGVYAELPAVVGPETEATRLAELWCARLGCRWKPRMRQRLYALERVVPPERAPDGALRGADEADLALIRDWSEGFARDTGAPLGDVRGRMERLAREGSVHLWDDGKPRSMLATSGWTPRGVRVGYVYTPPALRRRGYATSAVASLSQHLLEGGRRFCFLYTDLSNPTSNAIYARVGYRPVSDVVDLGFSESGAGT